MKRQILIALAGLLLSTQSMAVSMGIAFNSGSGDSSDTELDDANFADDDVSTQEFGFALVTGGNDARAQYRLNIGRFSGEFGNSDVDGYSMNNTVGFRIAGDEQSRLWLGPQLGWISARSDDDSYDILGISFGGAIGIDVNMGSGARLSAALEYRETANVIQYDSPFVRDDGFDTEELVVRFALLFPVGGN